MNKERGFILVFGPKDSFVTNSIFNNCVKYLGDSIVLESFNFADDKLKKLKNEPKRKILFSSNFSECEPILYDCEMIIYIHLLEENFYSESIMNRISYEKYRDYLWPCLVKESKSLLQFLNSYLNENKYLILDFSRSHMDTIELLKQISLWLKKGISIEKKFILKPDYVFKKFKHDLPKRDSDQIWQTFNKFRKIYLWQYSNEIKEYLIDLNCLNIDKKNIAIDNLIDLFSFKYKKIAEERNSFKKILSTNFANSQMPYRKILSEIEYCCKNADSNRLIRLADIFNYITDNSINRIKVLKDPEYTRILLKMLSNSNMTIQTKATELIYTMFKDSEFKNSKELDYYCQYIDRENSMLEKLLQIITNSCHVIFSSTNYDYVTKLNMEYKYLCIIVFKELLESSPGNWRRIKIDDCDKLLDLFDMGIQSISKTKHNFQVRLLSQLVFILGRVIKIIQNSILNEIKIEKYIKQTLILMNFCLNTLGEFSKPYFLMVYETLNIFVLLGEKSYFKTVKSYHFVDEIDFFIKYKHDKTEDEDDMGKSLVECYRKYLILMQKNNSIENFINFNKDQIKFSIEYSQMKIELENIKKEMQKKQTKIEELTNQIERLSNENMIYIEKLKAKTDKNLKHVTQKESKFFKKSSPKLEYSQIDENIVNSALDAKKFIQNIEYKYENISDFRHLICNSLKHLAENLYTSKYHFIYELIQNTDDSKFDQSPCLKIIIDQNSITFCSNEKGFNSSDIQSICSISESRKLKGLNIGNKGLGFKSVFSICNEPVIYSKPFWQFYFLKEKDELSYITPHYMEQLPDSLQYIINENESMNTFIFLKFKDSFIFSENIFDLLDPNILIFTNNLENLILEDKISLRSRQIKRNKKKFDHFELIELKNGNENSQFRVYNELIKIDDYLVKNEELACDEIKISIVFPNQLPCLNNFSVYSFFPVQNENIQWPFMVNTYWSLVTNRENLKICKYNDLLRDSLADMYCKIVNNDRILKENLVYILPSHERLNKWWCNFSTKIGIYLRQKVDIGFKRLRNKDLQSRLEVSDEILNYMNIEIFESSRINNIELEYYLDVRKVSIEDILSFFHIKNQNEKIKNWITNRSSLWWSIFFYELLSNKIFADPKKFEIFVLRENLRNENQQLTNFKENVVYFTNLSGNLVSWRKEISIVETRNSNEIKYLNFLNIANIERENMFEIILSIHKSGIKNFESNIGLIWNDLEFVKKNFDICNRQDVLSLFVPVMNGLLPLKFAKIPTLLCFNLYLMIKDEKIIDLPINTLTNYQILEWEYFFIKLGIYLPESSHFELTETFLRPLQSYDERETKLAIEILKLNENIINFIKQILPIKCSISSCSIRHQTIHLNSLELPNSHYIKIPDDTILLAEILGIKTKLNSNLCISGLETLVLENNRCSDEYVKWFKKLNEISDESLFDCQIENKKIICLKNRIGEKEFYSPNQVYINPKNEIIDTLVKYKVVINQNFNTEFLDFENLMIKLGFKNKPDVKDLIELINIISLDSNNFFNQNFLADLTYSGMCNLKSVYFYLENLLREKANFNQPITWENRLNLKPTIECSLKDFLDEFKYLPMLTCDHKLIQSENLQKKILVTSLNNQINKLFHRENLSTYFVCDCEIATNCPFIMSIIGCIYLEPNCMIKISHQTNNMEIVYPMINKMIKNETGLKDIQILNVVYIGIELVYDTFLIPINNTNLETNLKTLSLHSFEYIIIGKNTLICSTKNSKKSDFLSVYEKGLYQLLSLNFSPEEAEYKLKRCMEILENCLENFRKISENWSNASTEDTLYNMNQISFQEANYKSKFDSKLNNSKHSIEQSEYKKRALQILDSIPRINDLNSDINQQKYIKSYENIIDIGRKAKLFFNQILEIVYPGSFEWISFLKDNFVSNEEKFGYNFKIDFDYKKIFSSNGKKCLIEVKGFGGEWEGNFFIKKNEYDSYIQTKKNTGTDYIIVIIDQLNDKINNARIVKILNWSQNPNVLTMHSEVFKAIINPKIG